MDNFDQIEAKKEDKIENDNPEVQDDAQMSNTDVNENDSEQQMPEDQNVGEDVSEESAENDDDADVSPNKAEDNDEEEDNKKFKWYCLRTYTGHESKVKLTIEAELKRLGLKEKVPEIIIPQETVFEVRGGKRRTKIKNFLPGYIVLRVDLDKKIKDIIQNLPSVVSFVGTRTEPAPLRKSEIDRIIGRVEERKSIATIETTFEIGDPVKVIDGPFSSFNGTVKEVNFEKQKLKVEVGILGRKTPVELDFSQVEMENH